MPQDYPPVFYRLTRRPPFVVEVSPDIYWVTIEKVIGTPRMRLIAQSLSNQGEWELHYASMQEDRRPTELLDRNLYEEGIELPYPSVASRIFYQLFKEGKAERMEHPQPWHMDCDRARSGTGGFRLYRETPHGRIYRIGAPKIPA